ncbi:MAG: biopolymer transporter ExbD [Xanthomonadales bacterium]|nr:biopolymer transporter ExbD [Xanthomonadales bacterium]
MKLQAFERDEPEINLTSLIDVVFLLLIFFMVSTTFERQAALRVDLPEASVQNPPVEQPERLELVIDAEGRMWLNDRRLVDGRRDTLIAAFEEVAGERRDLPVVLRADQDTPHRYVVTAMDVSGEMGFTRLSIATQRDAPDGP